MLAISTTNTLSLLDPALIKRAPSSAPTCLSLTDKPTAGAWSLDNNFLFLASQNTIHRYEVSINSLSEIFSQPGAELVENLLSKDKATLIFSSAHKVHILDCGSAPKVSQTFESHKTSITSLSISNDASLVASTSANAAHVHNLSLGSHTVLRIPTLAGQAITTSIFHPHSRTRLLLGAGKQLMVYDTTRPSSPLKIITLDESTTGDIVAVACSPFSKTLVAAATSGGNVGLVDLDKDKGLFRTVNLKVPLTSLVFSPEGAAVYLGTENGKLLVLDLRGLDKAPKTILISDTGSRVETFNIQKKTKGEAGSTSKQSTNVNTRQTSQPDINPLRRPSAITQAKSAPKIAASPARTRTARAGSESTPNRRPPTLMKETAKASPAPKRAQEIVTKKVFSPVRDPLGNSAGNISVDIKALSAIRGKAKVTPIKKEKISVSRTRPSPSPKTHSTRVIIASASTRTAQAMTKDVESPRRARTVPAASRKLSSTASTSAAVNSRLTIPGDPPPQHDEPHDSTRPRSRAVSSASRAGSGSISARSARTTLSSNSRPGSSASRPASSPVPPMPFSRTPSPDLLHNHVDPATPIAMRNKGLKILGLGTPEVDRWIKAGKGQMSPSGKGKGKTVGFATSGSDGFQQSDVVNVGDDELAERTREKSLSMQISPRRPVVNPETWAASPQRHPMSGSPGTAGGSAHELLRTIVQDVMYDFQRETKAEMTGLHLDLLRMGRGWKQELRGLMDEYVGDLNDLREENKRLREENERLRRGY